MIARLFNPEHTPTDSSVIDFTYDSTNTLQDESHAWVSVIKDRLSRLFERHGAIELESPLLAPAYTVASGKKRAAPARFLDSQGKLVGPILHRPASQDLH